MESMVLCASVRHLYHSAIAQRKIPTKMGSQQAGKVLKGWNQQAGTGWDGWYGLNLVRLINYKSTCDNNKVAASAQSHV